MNYGQSAAADYIYHARQRGQESQPPACAPLVGTVRYDVSSYTAQGTGLLPCLESITVGQPVQEPLASCSCEQRSLTGRPLPSTNTAWGETIIQRKPLSLYLQKLMIMSAVEIRAEIQSYLEKVQDESFLKVVHSMLDAYVREHEDPIIGYDVDGVPLYASVARKLFKEQLEGVERGEYITIEDLEKEMEKW